MTYSPNRPHQAPPIEGIDDRFARNLLSQHKIELAMEDPRSSLQYITELLVFIDAIEQQQGDEMLAHEITRGTPPIGTIAEGQRPPYFAR